MNDNSAFFTFGIDNPLILCPLCKSKTLWNIFMILGRNVEPDNVLCTRMAFFLLELSPFVMSDKNDNSGFLPFGVISLCYV